MNDDALKLKPGVQRLLEDHIDAVDRQLMAAGKSRTDRLRVCDDLEIQIREMLSQRVSGEPTEGDLRAVLAELDRPEAYGEGEREDNSAKVARLAVPAPQASPVPCRSWSRVLIFSIGVCVAGFLSVLLIVAVLGILAAIAVPNFHQAQTRSKVARARADQRTLATAIEAYFADYKAYPSWTDGSGSAFGELSSDPFLRGQPTFRAQGSLTTPVAYLTSYPPDPFSRVKGQTYCYFSAPQSWMAWSAGPDCRYDLNLRRAQSLLDPVTHEFRKEMIAKYSYDTTNGTVSAGDIIRCKNDGPFYR